jgi:hypothetical protein
MEANNKKKADKLIDQFIKWIGFLHLLPFRAKARKVFLEGVGIMPGMDRSCRTGKKNILRDYKTSRSDRDVL